MDRYIDTMYIRCIDATRKISIFVKRQKINWHCPHFHIMSVYALPPTRAISRIRTRYKDYPKAQGEHKRRSGLLE